MPRYPDGVIVEDPHTSEIFVQAPHGNILLEHTTTCTICGTSLGLTTALLAPDGLFYCIDEWRRGGIRSVDVAAPVGSARNVTHRNKTFTAGTIVPQEFV